MFTDKIRRLATLQDAATGRISSWDKSGGNRDFWTIPAGECRVLADIRGKGAITHLWMTQGNHYRECLLRITYDDAPQPSVLCPLGDFFGLGHGMVNSYQSMLFSASTCFRNRFNSGCALNCYVLMPFQDRVVVELINESNNEHHQYFYVDYELSDTTDNRQEGYFHAEFRRRNPFNGWGIDIPTDAPVSFVANKGRDAWNNNYVILETRGRGHYIGCNLSVTNFQGAWWGEGDDMIWIDGYKWPPDLHGTGSEDYFNQAWGMQDNAFLRNGSSIFEGNTLHADGVKLWRHGYGGYQTSYVHHIENPIRFQKEIKVTIEHGHANHLTNEMSSVAYWYAEHPSAAIEPPPVAQRFPVLRDNDGKWLYDKNNQTTGGKPLRITAEIRKMKTQSSKRQKK